MQFYSRLLPVLLCLFLISSTGCSSSSSSQRSDSSSNRHTLSVKALQVPDFYLEQERYGGWEYGSNNASYELPVITLGSSQQITLSFRYFGTDAKQFRVNLEHYSPDWQPSNVPQSRYMDGLFEDYFGGGQQSSNTNLIYRTYTYQFPAENQRPTVSGNYMITIRDYDSNAVIARLPFMVTEQKGQLQNRSETLYNAGPHGEPRYQPFSTYTYPDFVEMPRFDLTYRYLPLPFWGDQREVEIVDYLDKGAARFHLSRPASFAATLLRTVNLEDPRPDGRHIDEVQTLAGSRPVQVLLDPDEVNLEAPNAIPRPTLFGQHRSSRSAQVLDVTFRFLNPDTSKDQKVYLLGNFNGWSMPDQPMTYNASTGYWEQTVTIPEGQYQYQYMRLVGGKLKPIVGAYSYADIPTPFAAQVYYQDPNLFLYRLLNVAVSSGQ
jgi:hypothetical protein